MHGIIHLELQKFVEQSYGKQTSLELLRRAGLESEIYTPLRSYPDEQVVTLVAAAVEATGTSAVAILEAFGEFLVPTYLSVYGVLVRPEWRTLELIEHTEEVIHRVVRTRQPGARPPSLDVKRIGPDEIVVHYQSPRRLCAVARGIVRGVAKHFGERVLVSDDQCMLTGDRLCALRVRRHS